MKRLWAVLGALAGLALIAVGVVALADRTMSRHRAMPAQSKMLVSGDASTRGYGEHGLAAMTHALFLTCRLEVESEMIEESFVIDEQGRFSALLRPALDESDRRQLHGCLEDARVDNLQVEVTALRRIR